MQIATRLWVLVFVAGTTTCPLAGQGSEALPVVGTLAYRALLHGEDLPTGRRFSGRVGVRLAAPVVVGFHVGSWASYADCGEPPPAGCTDADLAAVEYLFYVQHGLTSRVFGRAGIGYADTRTVTPTSSRSLAAVVSQHFAWSVGVGWDSPSSAHLAGTIAVDFTEFSGAGDGGQSLKRAFSVGLGITVG